MTARNAMVAVLAWFALWPLATRADESSATPTMAKIKSAYLLNFMRFSEWPATAFESSTDPLQLCIAGEDSLDRHVDRTMRGQSVAGRTIKIRRLGAGTQSTDAPASCHVVYISASELPQAATILGRYAGTAALTVGETNEFVSMGAMLALNLENDRIVFYANPAAIAAAPVHLSSKILQLARVVTPTEHAGGL